MTHKANVKETPGFQHGMGRLQIIFSAVKLIARFVKIAHAITPLNAVYHKWFKNKSLDLMRRETAETSFRFHMHRNPAKKNSLGVPDFENPGA